ncbi:MAG: phosphoribosylformylglycinamidine synthase I [Spirochaetaceae bacterium]|nr:phosphoribosylformylglycinamidine synthase I [Spirochaetaceae bacterium]
MKPKALVLHAAGINRDGDVVFALECAGAEAEIVHINELRQNRRYFQESQILVIPGGFSYADALGAGTLFALDIASFFRDETMRFVESGKPVIGICNGFQTLVRAGILPGIEKKPESPTMERYVTLTTNEKGRFECRWVSLKANPGPCIWTEGIDEIISCPVAHGEGRLYGRDRSRLDALSENRLIALSYCRPDGSPANGHYPDNPNGSLLDIAGLCNPKGNVLGLMPHPEDNVVSGAGARAYRTGKAGAGLAIFRNGVRYATQG